MAFTKHILLALVAATATIAQSSGDGNCPQTDDSGVYNIQNQGDASALQNCQKFDGSINIQSQTVGNIDINGVQSITGNLSAVNAIGLTSLASDQLSSIGGYFTLRNLTVLSNLQMSSLSEVNVINFEGCPNLQSLNFDNGVEKANGVRIVNTKLNSLSGIELGTVSAFEVTNNNQMTEFNVNNLKSVSSSVTVAANGKDLKIDFPHLETAANLTFRNISALSVPSLTNVTGSFGCYSNYFESFSAPNMTMVGNALVFADNSQLTNISIPGLENVGGTYQIANNTHLKVIDGFTKLKSVGGALDFSGIFTNVSLPALAKVQGTFNMQSTGTLDCSTFQNEAKKLTAGKFTCKGELDKASSENGGSSTTSGGGGSKPSPNAASMAIDMSTGTMGVLGAVAAALIL